jgi:hypothetical protein
MAHPNGLNQRFSNFLGGRTLFNLVNIYGTHMFSVPRNNNITNNYYYCFHNRRVTAVLITVTIVVIIETVMF